MSNPKQAQHLVLLQIVSDLMVWLECRTAGDGVEILGAGRFPMPSGDAEASNYASPAFPQVLQETLAAISRQLHLGWFTRHDIVFVAPSHRLSARFIETPAADEANIRDLVAFEVSEALQVPVERITWDMLISSQHGPDPEKHLLWMATRKEYIDTLLQSWSRNRLYPTGITAELWALYEFVLGIERSHLAEPAILVSREGDRATITVANSKAVYFTRSITLARPARQGESGPADVSQEDILVTEINRTLFYTRDRFPQGTLHKIILIGFEGWDLTHLRYSAREQDLQVSTLELSDVLAHFSKGAADLGSEHISLLCIAHNRLVRNLEGLNLLREEPRKEWSAWVPESAIPLKQFGVAAGALACLLLGLWIGQGVWIGRAAAVRSVDGQDLLQLAGRLQREEVGLREMARTHIKYADMFLFLAQTLPEDILVKSISLDQKNGVDLSLTGGSQQAIGEVLEKMNKSPYFRELTITRAANENEGFTVYVKGKIRIG